jgi:2-enoate reductase
MRFTCECIAAIKANVPKGFPVLVKFTPYYGVEGVRTLDEGVEMAKILEGAGVDALHVDVGCYEAWYKAISTVYAPEGHQLPVVSAIKKVATVPVLGQGKLFDPAKAEEALQDGTLGEVVLAHQMLADPFWPKKVEAGHLDDIRPCIGCNECLLSGFSGKHYYCAVNPECYAERDYMRTQVLKKGVEVVLGKDATTNEIVSFGADKVILTTGAHSIVPPIEGVEKAVISDAILLGKIQAQGHVVVIGGGLVGCETACMAVETAEDVTIVEVLDEVLKTAGHCLNNDQALKAMMEKRQVRTICSAKVTKIEDGSLSYEKDGKTETVPCDMAVLACGYRPNDGLAAELEGRVKDLSVIGDAEAPRKILTAVHEGIPRYPRDGIGKRGPELP